MSIGIVIWKIFPKSSLPIASLSTQSVEELQRQAGDGEVFIQHIPLPDSFPPEWKEAGDEVGRLVETHRNLGVVIEHLVNHAFAAGYKLGQESPVVPL